MLDYLILLEFPIRPARLCLGSPFQKWLTPACWLYLQNKCSLSLHTESGVFLQRFSDSYSFGYHVLTRLQELEIPDFSALEIGFFTVVWVPQRTDGQINRHTSIGLMTVEGIRPQALYLHKLPKGHGDPTAGIMELKSSAESPSFLAQVAEEERPSYTLAVSYTPFYILCPSLLVERQGLRGERPAYRKQHRTRPGTRSPAPSTAALEI